MQGTYIYIILSWECRTHGLYNPFVYKGGWSWRKIRGYNSDMINLEKLFDVKILVEYMSSRK